MDELDPRKLYELSESLNELTGTVKYTDEAMRSMLGPQAEANKKLKESGKARADAEAAGAGARNKEVSKQAEAEGKQQKLFEDELRYRGYKIEQTGALTKTTTELSVFQKQSLETLDKRISKERQLARAVEDPVKEFRRISTSVNSLDGVLGQMQEGLFEMTGKNVAMAAGLTLATSVISGVVKAATGMAEALFNGERGAKVGAKAMKDLNETVSKALYLIGGVMMFTGVGTAVKILGGVVAAFGFALEKSTKLIEMGAEYNDKVYDSFNKLSEVGLTTSKGMSGVSTTLEKLNLTSAEIEKFNSLLVSGSKDLALFGGTASSGLEKFAGVANQITGLEGPAKELNRKLMLLGISSDEQREHTLKYMALQTRMGMAQGKTQADLVKGSVAYMEELDRIAAITGIGRKEQEEAQKQVMAIEELRAAMYQAEKSGDTKRQAELEQAMKYSSRLMAEGRKKEAAGVAKYYAAGKNVIDAESAMAMQNSAGAIEAIGKGQKGEDVYQAGIESARESAKRTAGTKRIGGDVSNLIGDFNATLDAIKASDKLQAEVKKSGLTPEAYAKKIQEEKQKGDDDVLKKNVEAIQIQQKAGLNFDQAAKAMDGAGLAMASSIKAFNEAVKLFQQASGTGQAQGVGVEKARQLDTAALNKQQSAMDANKQTKADPNATAKQKADAQKAEDDANRESMKAMAAKREALFKEQNELRELNKKQRGAGKEVFKTMEDARKAGAAPASAPAAEPVAMGNEGRRGAIPSSGSASPSPSSASEAHSEGGSGKAAEPTAPKTAAPVPLKSSSTKSDLLIANEPKTAAPVPLKSSSTKSDLLIANEPVTADKPLSKAQVDIITLGISQGNKFSDMVMKKLNSEAFQAAPVAPTSSETIPINKADAGGIFDGPGKNSVMINSNSMPANDILTSLRESFGSVQKKSIESEVPKLTKFNTMSPGGRGGSSSSSMDILERFTDIMEQKMSDVIDAISDNNNIKEEILLYSKA
jgi:hypothetical protein